MSSVRINEHDLWMNYFEVCSLLLPSLSVSSNRRRNMHAEITLQCVQL